MDEDLDYFCGPWITCQENSEPHKAVACDMSLFSIEQWDSAKGVERLLDVNGGVKDCSSGMDQEVVPSMMMWRRSSTLIVGWRKWKEMSASVRMRIATK